MSASAITIAVLLGSIVGAIVGFIVGREQGRAEGRDAQFVDDFIAAGERDRSRRDAAGRFKSKASP